MAKAVEARSTSAARRISEVALVLLILSFPLPVHWVVVERRLASIYGELTDLVFYPADGAMLLFLGAALFWVDWRKARSLRPRIVLLPLVLLSLWSALSVVWAFDMFIALQWASRLLMVSLFALVVVQLKPGMKLLQRSMLVMLLIQAASAFTQFIIQGDLGLGWLGEITLNPYPGGGSIIQTGDRYVLRAYGLTPHPNILGGIVLIAGLLLVAPVLGTKLPAALIWFGGVGVGVATAFITFSRAAWLGGMMGGLLLMSLILLHPATFRIHWRRLTGLVGLVLIILIGSAVTNWPLLQARSDPASSEYETRSVEERAALNQAGWAVAKLAPLTGVGAGNSTPVLLPLLSSEAGIAAQPIHNLLLLLLAELGPVGASLWIWLSTAPLFVSIRRARQGRLTIWAAALTAALVAFAAIDMFDYYGWGWNQGRVLRWLLWGLWGAAMSQELSGVSGSTGCDAGRRSVPALHPTRLETEIGQARLPGAPVEPPR